MGVEIKRNATAIERANAAGRSTPIEEDYLATPPITTDVAVAPTVNQKVDGFLSTNFLGGPLPNTSPSTGMANIPATVPSTGQSHKDFEIQQRQEQGAYIPPGMTTSAGVPVEAQAGGGMPDFINTGKDQWGRSASYKTDDGTWVNRSNVFTPHYETGEALGVMTRNQRRAYDLAAAKAGF